MKRFLILLFLLISVLLNGKTFYLSPSGLDTNSGKIESPLFSLNKAWTLISAGDTVYMRGGVYRYSSTQFLKGKNGTSAMPIRIWAFPDEIPVVTKESVFSYTWSSGISFQGDYFHWKGIEITGFIQESPSIFTGLRITDSNNNIFELINSHHNGHGCVLTGKSNGNLVINCDFHHNQDPLTSPKYDNADGLEVCYIPAGYTNTIRGCRIYWNSDDGIDLWKNDGAVIIDNCWAWNNGFIPDTFTPAGNGNGIKMGITTVNHGTAVLRTVTNSLTYNNRARGFDQNEALCSFVMYNNTAYQNGTNGYVLNYGGVYSVVKNCISFKNRYLPGISQSSITGNNAFADYNLPPEKFPVSDQDFVSLDPSHLLRSRKPDGNLPDIEFLNLSTNSSLVDAGAQVGLPFNGKAPDIGAFEVRTGESHINKLPTISISFPTKGTSFSPPATVSVTVEASDPDGSIEKVELFDGSKKLAEATVAPYSFTLKDLPAGTYKLKAVATDDLKASTTSAILEVSVVAYNEKREYFNLYPNPNNGCFTVDFSSLTDTESFAFSVVDLIGNVVYREEIMADQTQKHFDLSHLNSGIYVLMIAAGQILLTQKIIINQAP